MVHFIQNIYRIPHFTSKRKREEKKKTRFLPVSNLYYSHSLCKKTPTTFI